MPLKTPTENSRYAFRIRRFVCWSYSDFRISVNNFVNIGPTEKIKIPFCTEFHGNSSDTIDFEIPVIFKKLEILFLPSLQLDNCPQTKSCILV